MIDKDPMTGFSWLTYLWVWFLASWGGVANYMRKVRDGVTHRFSVVEFIGEIIIAALAGMITFWLCEQTHTPRLIGAAMIAVSGHMGTRAIFAAEKWLQVRFP